MDDAKEGETDGFDNQNAIECKPREKGSHVESMLNPHMMTTERQGEDTKVLEFLPGRKPEVVDVGETIRFMHRSHDGSSSYWLQGILDKRIDKYEDAKKSRWNKNRFRVNSLGIIKHWGDLEPLPETLTTNLTKESAWSLGTEVELATMKRDSPTTEKKDLAPEFESNDNQHDNSSNNDATKDNPGNDDNKNPSPNIIELDSKQLESNDNKTRIRLGYDAIRDMNLKGNTRESDERKPDGYLNIVNVGHEVSLSPFGGRLDSPFETSPGNNESSNTEGCREAEPRQESIFPILSDDESRETGIITIIM